MRVLITGVAGFLGSRLARRLLDEGWDVQGLDIVSKSSANRIRDLPIDYLWASCHDLRTVDVTHIVHCAAIADIPFAIENPIHTFHQNILGTASMMEVATSHSKQKIERVIIISSESVYGRAKHVPITEEEPPNPSNVYGVSKASEEMIARSYHYSKKLPITILRSASMYGEGSRVDQVIPIFLRLALEDKPIVIHGKGLQTRDFNYIDNVIDGIILALKSDDAIGETFNIASGQEKSIAELAEICKRVTGSKSEIKFEGERAGEEGRLALDIAKAQRVLGYRAKVDLDEGIQRVTNWMKKVRS